MYRFIGHLLQFLHLLVSIIFPMILLSSRSFTVLGYAWVAVYYVGSFLSIGILKDCIFTIVSNKYFTLSNHPGYDSMLCWVFNIRRKNLVRGSS